MKQFSNLFLVSLLSGATTLGAYKLLFDNDGYFSKQKSIVTLAPENYGKNVGLVPENSDFTVAADKAIHTVVHVKNVSYTTISNPIMEFFYGFKGQQQQEQVGTGSGVIISEDGYIVTNNHVIKDATEIEITLNNKKAYKAKVIGSDSKMDIALLKIDTDEKLAYSTFADSDNVKVGQWVLAVGNPYNLNSTVTAGIISAKARNLGTNGIQSFIQTDAAVNPGNSGGALVNTSGELVGINSAIASPTGSYAGYAYAIPVNMVKKVVTDIVKYGTVQRAYLGISYPRDGLSEEELKKVLEELNTKYKEGEGILITDVLDGGAAKAAGIKKGDVLIKINGVAVKTSPELQEQVSRYKPGDKMNLIIKREGKDMSLEVILRAKLGTTDLVKSSKAAEKLGGKLETIDKATAEKNDLEGGVLIKELGTGIIGKSRIEKGFVITHVNEEPVKTVEEFYEALKKASSSSVKISGVYPGYFGNYAFILNLNE